MYDAMLFVGDDQGFPLGRYALALHYLRNLSADQIVAASAMEMARLSSATEAEIHDWTTALQVIMPDIKNGDRLLGVFDAKKGVTFFYNDVACGEIASPGFAEAFGSIWLSEGTRSPALRVALLGGGEDRNARADSRSSAALGEPRE